MSRSYTSSPLQTPTWCVAGQLTSPPPFFKTKFHRSTCFPVSPSKRKVSSLLVHCTTCVVMLGLVLTRRVCFVLKIVLMCFLLVGLNFLDYLNKRMPTVPTVSISAFHFSFQNVMLSLGARHRPVGKFAYREMYPWDELVGTVGCFLAFSHTLDQSLFFKMADKLRNCRQVSLYEKLSTFFKTVYLIRNLLWQKLFTITF
jgi:hypothetical protein